MKLLVAVDGSTHASHALEMACRMASKETDSLVLVVVVEEYSAVDLLDAETALATGLAVAKENEELHRRALELLEQAASECAGRGIPYTVSEITGNPRDGIIDAAKANNADIIVMGCRGFGAVKRLLLGSVSDYVVQHAPCSVLVCREPPH